MLRSLGLSPDSIPVGAVQVTQLDRDTILIALKRESQNLIGPFEHACHLLYLSIYCICPCLYFTETVKIVNLQGIPSKDLASEMIFDFPIETLGTYLAVYKL